MKLAIGIFTLLAALLLLFSCSAATDSGTNKANGPVQAVIFPAYDSEKTENNFQIFEIPPFKMTVVLPENWSIRRREEGSKKFPLIGVWSAMGIFDGQGKEVGAVGYNIYEEYEGAEEVPQAIYNQIALGNGYQFNAQPAEAAGSYTPIAEKESGVTAVTAVYYAPYVSERAGYGNVEKENKGILSYNKDLLVYVACELDYSGVTDRELKSIAESIEITPA